MSTHRDSDLVRRLVRRLVLAAAIACGLASCTGDEAAAAGGMLPVGAPAPGLTLRTHRGETVRLTDLHGQPAVVYFYPKDDTPGCTVEAKGFRDQYPALAAAGVRVFGVSTDDEASHRAFVDKYDLPFELVMDSDGKVAAAFGVPLRATYAKRVTFVIGKDGKIARVYPDVDPEGHAQEILRALQEKG